MNHTILVLYIHLSITLNATKQLEISPLVLGSSINAIMAYYIWSVNIRQVVDLSIIFIITSMCLKFQLLSSDSFNQHLFILESWVTIRQPYDNMAINIWPWIQYLVYVMIYILY